MKHKRTYFTVALIVFLVVIAQNDVAAQCAMCKQAAESSIKSNPNSIAKGLNSGILYLMAVPYLMICFIFRKQIAQLWRKLRGKEEPASEEMQA